MNRKSDANDATNHCKILSPHESSSASTGSNRIHGRCTDDTTCGSRPAALASKLELLGYHRSDTESSLKSSIEILIKSVAREGLSPKSAAIDLEQRRLGRTSSLNCLLNLMDDLCEEALNLSESCEALSQKEEKTAQRLAIATSELQRLSITARTAKNDKKLESCSGGMPEERIAQLEWQNVKVREDLEEERRIRFNNEKIDGSSKSQLAAARDIIDRLRSEVKGLQEEKQREIALRQSYEANEQKIKASIARNADDLSNYSERVHRLEQEKIELVSKLSYLSTELNGLSTVRSSEQEAYRTLCQDMQSLSEERGMLRKSLEDMDADRDALEAQLDDMTSSLQHAEARVQDAERKLQVAESSAATMEQRATQIHQALSAREKEVESLRQTIQCMKKDQQSVSQILDGRNQALLNAKADLVAVTRESQVVAEETSKLANDLSNTKRRLEETARRANHMEHSNRTLELEKNDLLVNYRALIAERDALEKGTEEHAAAQQRLGRELHFLQEENRRAKAQLVDVQEELRQRCSIIANFERRLDDLSRQNLTAKRNVEAAESENRRLRMDLRESRESTGRISQQTYEYQRTVVDARQEVESVRSELAALENERNALQRVLSEERKRGEKFESLLASTRANEAAAAEQICRLAKENAEISTKFNEAKMRLGDSNFLMSSVTATTQVERSYHENAVNITQSPSPSYVSNEEGHMNLAKYLEKHTRNMSR